MIPDITHVLIIEREPEIIRALTDALQNLYDLHVIADAEEGRKFISTGNYFIAFVGERIEGFTAIEVLEFIRGNRLICNVIAVSDLPSPARDAELLENGVDTVIIYPFSAHYVRILAERAAKEAIQRMQSADMINRLKGIYLSMLGGDSEDSPFLDSLDRAAQSDEPILIFGERGSGKELVARVLHLSGDRPLGPFEALDARRVQSDELTTLLFGTASEPGAVARANGGTMLVKGLGVTPLFVQERLLNSLRTEGAGARFIFTTRLDLHGAALRGEFSHDLWSLLQSSFISVPALRERPESIPTLAMRILKQYSERLSSPVKAIHASALKLLKSHSWPGNLVELERIMVLGVVRASGTLLMAEDLVELQSGRLSLPLDQLSLEEILKYKLRPLVNSLDELVDAGIYDLVLSHVERPLLTLVMEKMDGNQLKAASALGIHRNTLRKKLAQLGIKSKGE